MKQGRTKQPCGGKIRYLSKSIAENEMELLQELRGMGSKKESRAYRCPKCGGWHLTSKKRRSR